MDCLIGLDGGGTKTLAALCDVSGEVLGRAAGEATNPTSVSRELVLQRLCGLVDELLRQVQGPVHVRACFGGFGGGGLPGSRQFMLECLKRALPNADVIMSGSDAVCALASGVGVGDGLVAIAGTGSSVFARVGGVMRQTGGWGYLLGDEGSGYDLGRRALAAALRALDGRGAATLLTALCEQRLGGPVPEHVARIYSEGRVFIASFAPLLLEALERGDSVARFEAEAAAHGLWEAIDTAGRALDMPTKPVVLVGSVWQPGGFMETQVQSLLGTDFRMIRPTLPPVYGSVLEAAALADVPVGAAFEARFHASWMKE